jgi:hypothetical protein
MHTKDTAIHSLLTLLFTAFLSVCAQSAEPSAGKRPSAAAINACTLIPKSDLERLIGRELRDGKQSDMPPGLSQCDFTTPPQIYVTRRFTNPPLPEAAGFSSVTITTMPTSPSTFAESRRLMADGEDVRGIGDAAYFSGPAMIFVRVGNRGFSIRLHVNLPSSESGRARLSEVMLSLARAGATKL